MSDSPRCLLDASSLMLLTKKIGRSLIPALERFHVLDLTLYEIGNALWKEDHLQETLTSDELASLIVTTERLLSVMKHLEVAPPEIGRVIELGRRENLTFYDASYLHVAMELKMVLVTEDGKLKRAAKKYVRTMGTAEFAEKGTTES